MRTGTSAALLLLIAFSCQACEQTQLTVPTSAGLVRGAVLSTTSGTVRAFLGIPYAESPIGDLRFQKPKPKEQWKGIYEATSPPAICSQPLVRVNEFFKVTSKENRSEDCLFLNVFAPANNDSLHAVLVYFHGGGFSYGGITLDLLDTSELSARENIITVEVGYRLGAFGFLNLGIEDAPGNMGLYDQVLAMRWVKENINSFGGDPHRITLMGQSAGAVSVGMHMISPKSRGLFHRAVIQSGSPFSTAVISDNKQAEFRATRLAGIVGCETNDTDGLLPAANSAKMVRCLRTIDAESILNATQSFSGGGLDAFFPVFGDELLPERPEDALRNGNFQAVDLLASITEAEGDYFIYYILNPIRNLSSSEGVTKAEIMFFLKVTLKSHVPVPSKPILDRYFKSVRENESVEALHAGGDLLGDLHFNCPTVNFAKMVHEQNNTVYMYKLSRRPSFSDWPEWVRATHADDIPYSLGSMYKITKEFTEADVKAATDLMKAVASFAKTG